MPGARPAHVLLRLLIAASLACSARAAVKRVVIIKLDGVPENVLERELLRVDPVTGKSSLPWIDRIFGANGARLENFYVRAISLSAPSWSLLDTGRHLHIRGNAEFDRYTYQGDDYLNFFPFYVGYALSRRVDMPGVEVLDDLGLPLLIDHFPYQASYQGFQLFQRGVRWKTLQHGFQQHFTSRSLRELLDEWTIGFEIGTSVEEQTERELIEKLGDPQVRYLDYFTGEYDHVAHGSADPAAQRQALQRIDAMVGRIWSAIAASAQAAETLLVVVSDHGMNTQPGVYSQGYDLVQFFSGREGGAHHSVTNRHPMTEYKLKGLDPFVAEVVTPSTESLYLKGASRQYPTALLDLDGNERASIYLRSSDLNTLHILLDELNRPQIPPDRERAALDAFFAIVDRHREEWRSTAAELRQELAALGRVIEKQRSLAARRPEKWTKAQRDAGLDKAARRLAVRLDSWRVQERAYTEYADALDQLIGLSPGDFAKRRFTASDLIPKRVMGDPNTIQELQNYVIGAAPEGLVLAPGGSLDLTRSFQRINYFARLASLAVKNNVQAEVGSHPVDFIAVRVPRGALALSPEDSPDQDAVWLYGDEDHQALVLARSDSGGRLQLRYLTMLGLLQDSLGAVRFEPAEPAPGFPLRLFEDADLAVPEGERSAWLKSWHSEIEWFHAIHKTRYSNGLIAVHEQFLQAPASRPPASDEALLERFQARRRRAVEPDFVVFAANHWNFNVRGFNPGGNHGSFLRPSMRSVLMFAGGERTGIPRNRVIEEPYDSLSFAPTLLDLMGLPEETSPMPGRIIRELLPEKEKAGARP
jgi:hypothetical protein